MWAAIFTLKMSRNHNHPAYYVFSPVPHEELAVLKSEDRRRFKIEDCLTSPRVERTKKGADKLRYRRLSSSNSGRTDPPSF